MDQNLNLYYVFHMVAKSGNISHASKELFISQPAVSKAITKLEEALGTTLFVRNSRGVKLTDAGILLYEHTQSAFDTLKKGEEDIKRIRDLHMGHIRIGCSTTLCKYLLLPYLKGFVQENPHIKVTIQCQSTFHTLKLLDNKVIDIGLVGMPDPLLPLTFMPIGETEDIFVATKSYLDNLKLREENPDIFQSANIMLLDEKNISRQYIEEYFVHNHIEPSQRLEVSNMDLLIEFAKTSLGVACVIKEFVLQELFDGTLIEIPMYPRIKKRKVGFAFPTKTPTSDATKAFITFIQKQIN